MKHAGEHFQASWQGAARASARKSLLLKGTGHTTLIRGILWLCIPGAVWEGTGSHGTGTCQGPVQLHQTAPGKFLDALSPASLAVPSHVHVLSLRRNEVCCIHGHFRLWSTEMLRQHGLNGCTSKLPIFTGLSLNVGIDFRSGCRSSDYSMFFCLIP